MLHHRIHASHYVRRVFALLSVTRFYYGSFCCLSSRVDRLDQLGVDRPWTRRRFDCTPPWCHWAALGARCCIGLRFSRCRYDRPLAPHEQNRATLFPIRGLPHPAWVWIKVCDPAQGASVMLMPRVARWQCLNPRCKQQTFGSRLPKIAAPYSQRTRRVVDLAHTAGGRPAERLMARLGAPQSKDTLLRSLKRDAKKQAEPARVVGVDDWSWGKGNTYGTLMVDLERHLVLDVLPDRSAGTTASWLACRPPVEIVSRDRYCLCAEGAAQVHYRRAKSQIASICYKIFDTRSNSSSPGPQADKSNSSNSRSWVLRKRPGSSTVMGHRR